MTILLLTAPDTFGQAPVLLAYLDPGSGSFILQLLVAGILGGLVALRMSWAKIKARLTRKPEASDQPAAPPEDKPGA
ncbi:MAG: hypothetical protein FJZ97_08240 [Chloroflexi bacterium]|nr:hypothetical protein [Chloroflexota bacterium]